MNGVQVSQLNFPEPPRHPPWCVVADFVARDYLIKSCVSDSIKHLNMLYKCECCLRVNKGQSGKQFSDIFKQIHSGVVILPLPSNESQGLQSRC